MQRRKKIRSTLRQRSTRYLARFQLSQLKQHSDEAVDDFIARCRVSAAKCKLADVVKMDTGLIEQLIIGTQHDYVRGKLLEKGDGLASLDKATDITRISNCQTYTVHSTYSSFRVLPSGIKHPGPVGFVYILRYMDSTMRVQVIDWWISLSN